MLLARPGVVCCHTAFDLRWLCLEGARLHPERQFHDTRVMGWLLEGNESLSLDDLCERWLGETPRKPIKVRAGVVMFESETAGLVPIEDTPRAELLAYNESDLAFESRLYEALRAELRARGEWEKFLHEEVPLARDILEMEVAGLPFDIARCDTLREEVEERTEELRAELHTKAGLPDSFNLGSTVQVGEYLFGRGDVWLKDRVDYDEDMRAAVAKSGREKHAALNRSRTLPEGFAASKVGRDYVHGAWKVRGRGLVAAEAGFGATNTTARPSTSSIPLVLKNPHDEWVRDFVLWRELTKLNGYLTKYPTFVGPDARLHGTLNRCGTATGRLSSSEPNLQNIPAHGEYGNMVRGLFAGDLVVGDYAQLEQRVAAHYSEDENLLRAYREGVDVYGLAASILFGGESAKEHPQRGLLKTGMLALQYGAGPKKMAELMLIDGHLGTTKENAEELIEQLHSVFPALFAWQAEVIERAIVDGFAPTLGGRRRYLSFPDNWRRLRKMGYRGHGLSREVTSRAYGLERQAVNAVCQGSAADIVNGAIRASKIVVAPEQATPLLQVHDEILWERGPAWESELLESLRAACEHGHGFELLVPLVFDPKEVASWAEKSGGASGASSLLNERMKRSRSEGMQSRKASQLARSAA